MSTLSCLWRKIILSWVFKESRCSEYHGSSFWKNPWTWAIDGGSAVGWHHKRKSSAAKSVSRGTPRCMSHLAARMLSRLTLLHCLLLSGEQRSKKLFAFQSHGWLRTPPHQWLMFPCTQLSKKFLWLALSGARVTNEACFCLGNRYISWDLAPPPFSPHSQILQFCFHLCVCVCMCVSSWL